MYQPTVRQLEYFVAAADAGSLTAAATRCQASQAAVSSALAELERSLGVQLLVRRPAKGVMLSRGGERLLPMARQLLADVDELARLAREEHDELVGPLRVACTHALSPRVLPSIAAAFTERHPRVELELADGLADDVQRLVRGGEADACVLYARQVAPGIDTQVVHTIEPYAVLSDEHPLAAGDDVALADLADERLILVQPAGSRGIMQAVLGDAGIVPRPGWVFTNPETVRAMVARGLGYSVFSGKSVGVETFDGRRVAFVRIRDAVTPNEIVLGTAHGSRSNARLDALLALLREPQLRASYG